jgi:hypothetical protein
MKHTITNILLAGILVLLAMNLFKDAPKPLIAAGNQLDNCVTEYTSGIPGGYLHVVTHMSSQDVRLQKDLRRQRLEQETEELQKSLKPGKQF